VLLSGRDFLFTVYVISHEALGLLANNCEHISLHLLYLTLFSDTVNFVVDVELPRLDLNPAVADVTSK